MSGHTPGPWKFVIDDLSIFSESRIIAETHIDDPGTLGWDSEEVDNAYLITAAPDLLAAVKLAVDQVGRDQRDLEWYDRSLAAIARAEGRAE